MTTKTAAAKIAWDIEQEEVFDFLFSRWDVRRAKRLLAVKSSTKVGRVLVENLKSLLQTTTKNEDGSMTITMGVSVDWNRVKADCAAPVEEQKIDLTVPLIFVQTKEGNVLPIDGWHRTAKAILLGVTELPAIMLSKKDSTAVRLA